MDGGYLPISPESCPQNFPKSLSYRAVFKLRYGIAAMCEPAVGVCCGHRRQGLLDRSRQRLSGTGLGGAHVGLDWRPGALDRRQIRRRRRPVEELGASPRNARANGGALMSAPMLQHDHLARAQRWAQDLCRVCVEDLGSRGPLDGHDRLDARQGEGRKHGEVGAIVLGHGPHDTFPPGRAAEPPRHGHVDARRVDTLDALESARLDQCLVVPPRVLAPLGIALARMECLV
jgi:hypothetical protein